MLEPQNPSIADFYVIQERRTHVRRILKLQICEKGRLGSSAPKYTREEYTM